MLWWFVTGIIIIILVLYIIAVYNKFVRLRNNIKKAFSNIDVLLRQRFDELTKLVKTVRGYAKHEKTVFEDITKARSIYNNATTIRQKMKADAMTSSALERLFAVAENYPNLKAKENFLHLQQRIGNIEEGLANARQNYNNMVMKFNILRQRFPTNILASIFSIEAEFELFKALPKEKQDVNIEF